MENSRKNIQTPNFPKITDLSSELLCHIIKFLPLKEILSLAMQCHKLACAVRMHFELCKFLDFSRGHVFDYMPSSITDDHMHSLLRKCPRLELVYGLHPHKVERRRLRKRSALTVPGIIEALCLCPRLKGVETCDLRLLEAILQHLPQINIMGHFRNRDGIFPPHPSQRIKLLPYPRIASLHLIGVEVPELTAMPDLHHLSLQCVRFTKLQPFRAFLAQNLRSFSMKHCMGPSMSLRYLSLIIALSSSPSLARLELVRVPLPGGLFQRAVEDSYKNNGFVNLRTIVISGCKGVLESDIGPLMIVASRNLRSLSIQPSLTKDSLFVSLSFARCDFSKLKDLHLGYVDEFSSIGEWSNDVLVTFGMAEVPDVPSSLTDSGMKVIGQLFPDVQSLSVSNCPHLMSLNNNSPSGVEMWKKLEDLVLQRCHCLRLHSFALFLALLPKIETVLIKDMFKEPPKGCSHVGLSAGTGLGMSSAVVSNQDEHIAVQGHQQDLEPQNDDPLENDEVDRELIDVDDELFMQAENNHEDLEVLGEEAINEDEENRDNGNFLRNVEDNVAMEVTIGPEEVDSVSSKDESKKKKEKYDAYAVPSTSKATEREIYGSGRSCDAAQSCSSSSTMSPSREVALSIPDLAYCDCPTRPHTRKQCDRYKVCQCNVTVPKKRWFPRSPNDSDSDSADEQRPKKSVPQRYSKRKHDAGDQIDLTCDIPSSTHGSADSIKKPILPKSAEGGKYTDNASSAGQKKLIEEHLVFDPSLPSTSRGRCSPGRATQPSNTNYQVKRRHTEPLPKSCVIIKKESCEAGCSTSSPVEKCGEDKYKRGLASNAHTKNKSHKKIKTDPKEKKLSSNVDTSNNAPSTSYHGPFTRNMKMQSESNNSEQSKKTIVYKETRSYQYKNQAVAKKSPSKSSGRSADKSGPRKAQPVEETYRETFIRIPRSRVPSCLNLREVVVSEGTQATSHDIRRSLRRRNNNVSGGNGSTVNKQEVHSPQRPLHPIGHPRSRISHKEIRYKKLEPSTCAVQDKSTSTSDPLLEDDAVQTLRVVSESLISLTIISCGLSNVIIDHCHCITHVEAQACRILKEVELHYCPHLSKLNISQCPKMSLSDLAYRALSLQNSESSLLVYYEPCMQQYNYTDGEKAIFSQASSNQGVVLLHDFSVNVHEGVQASCKERLLKWLECLRLILKIAKRNGRKQLPLEYTDPLSIASDAKFPWGHRYIRRIHDQMPYSVNRTTTGNNFQILTNDPLFSASYDNTYTGKGISNPVSFGYDNLLRTLSSRGLACDIIEWKKSPTPWHVNLTGFYIQVYEKN